MHTPIKGTIHFAGPTAVPDKPIHIDGLLAWSRVRAAMETFHPNPFETQHDLPLDKAGEGDHWVWKASQLVLEQISPVEQAMFVRKYDLNQYAKAHGTLWTGAPNAISGGTGHSKGYNLNLATAWFSKATFWAVGDIEECAALLKRIEFIGKKRNNGWGKIAKIELQPDRHAEQLWMQRTLPSELKAVATPQHVLASGSIRAPYWDRSQWREVLEYAPAA